MKTLIVYFSWSGITARVAKKIAELLPADLEEIKCPEYKNLFVVFWLMLFARNKELTLAPLKNNPADYDLVIVGAPTWAGRPPRPVIIYLNRYARHFKQAAFFSTSADPREQQVLKTMEAVSGKSPVAVAHFHRPAVSRDSFTRTVQEFVQKITDSFTETSRATP